MGKTAALFDADGFELGASAPEVDPNRVPAKAPAGKKEKKRRRKAKAKAGAGSRAESRGGSRSGSNGEAHGMVSSDTHAGASRRAEDEAKAKPSRRKRSGKTRVRADEGDASVELLTASEARTASRPSRTGANRRSTSSGGREAWRNYDEPSERRGRGGEAPQGIQSPRRPRRPRGLGFAHRSPPGGPRWSPITLLRDFTRPSRA